MTKLLMFDLDGTLADTFELFCIAFDHVATDRGFARFDRENERLVRGLDAVEVLAHHGVAPANMREIVTQIKTEMERRHEDAKLFPGIPEALTNLHARGCRLVLISSNARLFAAELLNPELLCLFEETYCDVPLSEKAAILKKCLHRLSSSAAADAAAYIGDELRDLDASVKAEIPFIGVTWGYNTPQALQAAGCGVFLSQPALMADELTI